MIIFQTSNPFFYCTVGRSDVHDVTLVYISMMIFHTSKSFFYCTVGWSDVHDVQWSVRLHHLPHHHGPFHRSPSTFLSSPLQTTFCFNRRGSRLVRRPMSGLGPSYPYDVTLEVLCADWSVYSSANNSCVFSGSKLLVWYFHCPQLRSVSNGSCGTGGHFLVCSEIFKDAGKRWIKQCWLWLSSSRYV